MRRIESVATSYFLFVCLSLQETEFPQYFWSHLMEEDFVTLYSKTTSNFVPKVREFLQNWKEDPIGSAEPIVNQMHKFALEHLSHHGVARATAYSISKYASKIEWTPKTEPHYTKVPMDKDLSTTIPYELRERLKKPV